MRDDLDNSPAAVATQSPWIGHALALVVLAASLLLVWLYWHNAQRRGLRAAETDFGNDNQQMVSLLQQRLINYELLARGGASMQTALPQPSRLQWQRYVTGLDLERRFPAVQALGFAVDVPSGRLDEFRRLLPGAAGSTGRPDARHSGRRAMVLYTMPDHGPAADMPGADLGADAGRQRALQASAASATLQVSGPLVRRAPAISGDGHNFALFAPVYAHPGERRDAAAQAVLRGWVFVEVRAERFVAAALDGRTQRSRLRIIDAGAGNAQVLYSDPDFDSNGFDPDGGAPDAASRPAFVQSLPLPVSGREWRIEFRSPPLGMVKDAIPGLRLTLLTGLLGATVLFGIAYGMARTQSRAQALAVRMSDSYRRSEQRFRSAMRYSAIGKALLDRQGRILEANPALARILGISQQALAGSMLGDHFVDSAHDGMRKVERRATAEGAYRVTRRLRRSDGDVRHAGLTFAAVPSEVGEDFASLVQVEDVTERQRAEARVQALNRTLEARVALRTRELSHAVRELESFAYSVSHDLRAPLRSIDGFSRILSEQYAGPLDSTGCGYLQRIRAASNRMGELIDALLRMSRVSCGDLQCVPVDLSEMARESSVELHNGESGRQVAIMVEDGMTVSGDPALLRNLLDNLIENAWKFTRGHADACIEVGRNGDGEYFVRDNGTGFAPEYAGKLFRPFQRLHSEAEYAGHGIGLASVKRIVERHGGSIRAEGEVGRGAAFYFTIGEHPLE